MSKQVIFLIRCFMEVRSQNNEGTVLNTSSYLIYYAYKHHDSNCVICV